MEVIIKRNRFAAKQVVLIVVMLIFFPLVDYAQNKVTLKGKEMTFIVEELDNETWFAYDATSQYVNLPDISRSSSVESHYPEIVLTGFFSALEPTIKSFFAQKIKDQNIQVTNQDIVIFDIVSRPFPQALPPQLYDVFFVYPKKISLTGEDLESMHFSFLFLLQVECYDEDMINSGYVKFLLPLNLGDCNL